MSEPLLVYYSSESLNTQRFVDKLGFRSLRIPISPKSPELKIDEEFILICPTFAAHDGRGAVPKQVIKFLNDSQHKDLLKGVIGNGNRSFGEYFGYAGTVIAKKCNVPLLYKFELMGTSEDVENVKRGVCSFWRTFDKKIKHDVCCA